MVWELVCLNGPYQDAHITYRNEPSLQSLRRLGPRPTLMSMNVKDYVPAGLQGQQDSAKVA